MEGYPHSGRGPSSRRHGERINLWPDEILKCVLNIQYVCVCVWYYMCMILYVYNMMCIYLYTNTMPYRSAAERYYNRFSDILFPIYTYNIPRPSSPQIILYIRTRAGIYVYTRALHCYLYYIYCVCIIIYIPRAH